MMVVVFVERLIIITVATTLIVVFLDGIIAIFDLQLFPLVIAAMGVGKLLSDTAQRAGPLWETTALAGLDVELAFREQRLFRFLGYGGSWRRNGVLEPVRELRIAVGAHRFDTENRSVPGH